MTYAGRTSRSSPSNSSSSTEESTSSGTGSDGSTVLRRPTRSVLTIATTDPYLDRNWLARNTRRIFGHRDFAPCGLDFLPEIGPMPDRKLTAPRVSSSPCASRYRSMRTRVAKIQRNILVDSILDRTDHFSDRGDRNPSSRCHRNPRLLRMNPTPAAVNRAVALTDGTRAFPVRRLENRQLLAEHGQLLSVCKGRTHAPTATSIPWGGPFRKNVSPPVDASRRSSPGRLVPAG